MTTHFLKTWPVFYAQLDAKRFEVRKTTAIFRQAIRWCFENGQGHMVIPT